MSGIDYSKWDHLDYGSDDDDESSAGTPRVTTLNGPSRITTQSDGTLSIEPSSSKSPNNEKKDITNISRTAASKEDSWKKQWTERGGCVKTDRGRSLYWCQDRNIVTLRLVLHPEGDENSEITAKQLRARVKGQVYSYKDRHSAVGTHKTATLEISYKKGGTEEVLLQGTLPHAIHKEEDDEEEETTTLEWTIEMNGPGRHLQVVLYKATPMPDMVIWWKRPLMEFPEIELPSDDRNTSFQDAWNEAHQQFRAKVQRGDLPRQTPLS